MSREARLESADSVRRLLARATSRRSIPYLLVALLVILSVVIIGREVDHHIKSIEAWIADLGPWGMLAFVGLFAILTSFLLPDTPLCMVAGALFGLAWGVAVAVVGSLAAGSMQFALSRRLLRGRIEKFVAGRPPLASIQRAVIRDELRLQVLLRLSPINPATISYLLGAAGVRYPGFLLACLALAPGLLIEVYFGHAGKHMVRLASGNSQSGYLHALTLFGGLAVCIIVMVFVSRMARKALAEAVIADENPGSPAETL